MFLFLEEMGLSAKAVDVASRTLTILQVSALLAFTIIILRTVVISFKQVYAITDAQQKARFGRKKVRPGRKPKINARATSPASRKAPPLRAAVSLLPDDVLFDDDEEKAAPGWNRVYDPEQDAFFYWQTETGATQWDPPELSEGSESSEQKPSMRLLSSTSRSNLHSVDRA